MEFVIRYSIFMYLLLGGRCEMKASTIFLTIAGILIVFDFGLKMGNGLVVASKCPAIDTNKYIAIGLQKATDYMANYHLENMQKRLVRNMFVRDLDDSALFYQNHFNQWQLYQIDSIKNRYIRVRAKF